MKIRNGFVSNSSSSSFIIRGMKISTDEAIEKLGISQEEIDNCEEDDYEISQLISKKLKGFQIEYDGNCFYEMDYTTLIVGESLGYLNDGEAIELKEYTPEENEALLKKFEKLGFTGKLSTFVQMVSNDNY